MRQKNVASPRRAEPSVCVLLMRARGRCHTGAAQYQVHSVRRACQSQRGVATRPAAAYVSGSGGVRIQMEPCVAWTLLRMLPPSSSPASRLAGAGGRGGEGRAAMFAGADADGGLSLSLSRLPPPKRLPKRPRFSSGRFSSKREDEASRSLGQVRGRVRVRVRVRGRGRVRVRVRVRVSSKRDSVAHPHSAY